MTASPIYLTEADVGHLVTVNDAIATLEALFATWGQPSTSNLPRQRARLAGGAFNLMGAAYGAKGVHGLKAYAGVKGAQFHTLLYSSLDGKLKAMIEADLFGQMRTGAASGLATKLLANRMRRRWASSAPANNRACRSQPCARCGRSSGSRSLPVRVSDARPMRVRWKANLIWRCAPRLQGRPAWPKPTWWSPSPTRQSRCVGRTGSRKAHTSTWLAPTRRASFASWSQPASLLGRRSGSSASLSAAKLPAGHRRPT